MSNLCFHLLAPQHAPRNIGAKVLTDDDVADLSRFVLKRGAVFGGDPAGLAVPAIAPETNGLSGDAQESANLGGAAKDGDYFFGGVHAVDSTIVEREIQQTFFNEKLQTYFDSGGQLFSIAPMNLGHEIRYRRTALQWTLERLSEACGVDTGTIGALEVRNSTKSKYAAQILDALAAEETARAGTQAVTRTPDHSTAQGLVPLISWVKAGAFAEANDTFPLGDTGEWLPCPARHGPRTYALTLKGESMQGPDGYVDGEIVFIDPDRAAESGRDVIVRDPEGRVTFKRLKEDQGGLYLHALNPAWPERVIHVPEGSVFCGVAVGSFKRR